MNSEFAVARDVINLGVQWEKQTGKALLVRTSKAGLFPRRILLAECNMSGTIHLKKTVRHFLPSRTEEHHQSRYFPFRVAKMVSMI